MFNFLKLLVNSLGRVPVCIAWYSSLFCMLPYVDLSALLIRSSPRNSPEIV